MKGILLACSIANACLGGDAITRQQADAVLSAIASLPRAASAPVNSHGSVAEAEGSVVNGVFWHSNYDAAYELAVELDQPMLLLFSMDKECKWCEVLKRFQEGSVADVLRKDFVCVRMPTDAATLKQWKISSYPMQIVEKHGNELRRWVGVPWKDSTGYHQSIMNARNAQR